MENTLACMTKFFMQHSTYSTYDKVKHTIKLLLLVYIQRSIHAELKDGPNYITEE